MADKPTPINREKFLNNLHDSYQIPETILQPYSNLNPEAKYTKPGQPEFTRANEISMKGDISPNIKISLEDHDETILYYIKNHIKPTVEINGYKREVPVLYGSPERWKSVQKDGFYRDKNGKIQTPLIILKRESFEKNRTIGNKLDGNKANNIQYFKQGYSRRNSYDNFSVLTNQRPSEEYKVSIVPDYITITYKLTLFTDYVEHMNQLIEEIEFASDSYWGDKEKFMFRANITSYPTPVVIENGDDRISRSDLTLTVNGYIIPKSLNAFIAAPSPKSFNVTKLLFKEILVDSRGNNEIVRPTIPITPVASKQFTKLISGTSNIILESEHGLSFIASIDVYDSSTNEVVGVEIIRDGTTVTILTNTPLDNHLLVIKYSSNVFTKSISGTDNTIFIAEHGINPISSIEVYDSITNEKVITQIIQVGTTISVLTNTPLNNHLLIIA